MTQKTPIIALVGLCGAGKSEVANYFIRRDFKSVRFGQIVLDEIISRGLTLNEANERKIRESLRHEHGMAAFAKLNMPLIDKLHTANKKILIDGLYSWSEYKLLKKKYGQSLTILAVYAPPEMRYSRLENRQERHGNDKDKKYRSFSREESKARDYAEIENIEKAGPIVMADFTILNTGSLKELENSINQTLKNIELTI